MRNAMERADRGAAALDERALDAANPANSANPFQRRGFASANSGANHARTLAEEPEEQGWDALNPPPESTPEMFFGLLGRFAQLAASGTEVNPVAAMAAAMSWLSSCMGRNPAITIGDEWHHLRLFTLHVGRSSRGGKGMATGLLKRVVRAIERIDGTLTPQLHSGGLSSREGLALLIHDGYREGKDDVPPIEDKRLFIIESEFANVLAQGKRDGNTLSTCIRDAWDGQSIKPATKSSRIWASRPHIALHGCITPTELRSKMHSGDLTNGFANRFLMIWAERTGVIPFPKRVSDADVDALAADFGRVISFGLSGYPAQQEPRVLKMSRQAAGLYADIYRDFAKPHPGGELITGLLQRRAPMLLRIAGLFAVTDLSHEINRDHLVAAQAWMTYFAGSAAMIFGPTTNPELEATRNDEAVRLLGWLKEAGDWRSRKAITTDCFKGHLSKSLLNDALDRLMLEGRIERRRVDTGGTTPRTDYRAKVEEFAESSRKSSQAQKPVQLKSSQSSQSSHAENENEESPPTIEVIL